MHLKLFHMAAPRMALLSDLVRVVASVEGLEEVSVGIFARHAREAGFIAQGGRGRSAAKMSIRDAANLIIAVNGCSLAKEVPSRVKSIRDLQPSSKNFPNSIGLAKEGSTFGSDLEFLLQNYQGEKSAKDRDELGPPVYVRFIRPGLLVDIELLDGTKIRYDHEVGRDNQETGPGDDDPDRWDQTEISSRTLRAVAHAL